MKPHIILQADYLDILFDNRNKLYGSYVLRKTHSQRMLQALAIVVISCMVFLANGLFSSDTDASNDLTEIIVCPIIKLVDPDKILPSKPKEVKPEPPAVKPTLENLPPVIAPDELVTELPKPVDSFVGRESGKVSTAGSADGAVPATTMVSGNGKASLPAVPEMPLEFSEVMPTYKGDIYAYLNSAVKYPRAAVQSGIEGRVIVQFVVYEDGSINNVKVLRGIGGGCDEEAIRVIKAMPAWEPGVQNGKKVKVNFKLPIKFKLN